MFNAVGGRRRVWSRPAPSLLRFDPQGVQVAASVEDATDLNAGVIDAEHDRGLPAEPERSQPGAQIVPPGAALRKISQPQTGSLDPVDVGRRTGAAGLLGDVGVEVRTGP